MAQPCVGLSQADLDAMCQEDDVDSPPSPIDEDLYGAKRRRRITLSAMGSEITTISETTAETEGELAKVRREALSLTTDPQQGGLGQAALDELQVTEESHAGVRESSPVGSALRILKRRRDSTGAGVEAMTARAIELARQAAPVEDDGGLTQKELDELGTCQQPRSESPESGCASEALSMRRRRAFRAAAPSPVKTPHSPRRRRSRAAKLDAENVGIMTDAENTKIDANADCASVPSFPTFSKSPTGKEPESPLRRAPRMRQCPLSPVNGCI
jgi:hypothetical protein